MNHSLKILFVTLLFALLPLSLVQIRPASAADWSAEEETLKVARDLFRLDLRKYNPQLVSHVIEPLDSGQDSGKEDVSYTLGNVTRSADGSVAGRDMDFGCTFRGKTLIGCSLYVTNFSTLFYTEPQPATYAGMAKNFLARYQNYTGAAYIQALSSMLVKVDFSKNMVAVVGNVKVEVSVDSVFTHIRWTQMAGGLETFNGVGLVFERGYLHIFRTDWGTYEVGSAEARISRQQAIQLALNAARSYKLQIPTEDGHGWATVKFSVREEPVNTQLMLQSRGNSTLYPLWQVQVFLDKIYCWSYSITVSVWADTGEVEDCQTQGGGGMGLPLHWGLEMIRPNNLTSFTAYTVTSENPEPNAVNVPLNAPVTVSWNSTPPIQELHLTPEVPIAFATEDNGASGTPTTWHLAEQLKPSTTYTATVIFGDHGNAQNRTWSFTTASAAPTAKTTLSPSASTPPAASSAPPLSRETFNWSAEPAIVATSCVIVVVAVSMGLFHWKKRRK
jgi:hypothetical protein